VGTRHGRRGIVPTDPKKSAASAGLRYVCDADKGITRRMGKLGFEFFDPKGRRIRKSTELKRIAALAIPPAWTDVWICPDARGHLQATGRDARGRKQYRYHGGWRAVRDETKFDRLQAFAAALPSIRARATADLQRAGLPREKVLAAVVRLLEKSLIRVGNDEYAKQNHSFGLTTLRDGHVKVRGAALRFEFKGKSGVRHSIDVNDQRLARIVNQCRDLPGQELFQYIDAQRRRQDVTSTDVNAYLREISGDDFTAKDFRTWAGTVLAATAFFELEEMPSAARRKKQVLEVIDAGAGVLGNTRAVCRKSYIHPQVLGSYMTGELDRGRYTVRKGARTSMRGLRPDECAVLSLLERAASANRMSHERPRERRRAA
jgi:DNA topoisomerase-1